MRCALQGTLDSQCTWLVLVDFAGNRCRAPGLASRSALARQTPSRSGGSIRARGESAPFKGHTGRSAAVVSGVPFVPLVPVMSWANTRFTKAGLCL